MPNRIQQIKLKTLRVSNVSASHINISLQLPFNVSTKSIIQPISKTPLHYKIKVIQNS